MKLRSLAYVGIIGTFGVCALAFFGYSQYLKSKCNASSQTLTMAENEINNINKDYQKVNGYYTNKQIDKVQYLASIKLLDDKRMYYQDIQDTFTVVNKKNMSTYKTFSVISYSCSMLTLVSFGFCLKHADYVKDKEDK